MNAAGQLRLGLDLLHLDELDRLSERPWFTRFVFADQETERARSLAPDRRREFLAGRFAGKEAVLKLLGVGLFQGVLPRDIAVASDPKGAPQVVLCGTALRAASAIGVSTVAVSITHKGKLVAAMAIGC